MRRPWCILWVGFMGVAGLWGGGCRPAGPAVGDGVGLSPLAEGLRWEYLVVTEPGPGMVEEGGGAAPERLDYLRVVEVKGRGVIRQRGVVAWELERDDEGVVQVEFQEIGEEGTLLHVLRQGQVEQHFSPPLLLLPAAPEVGDSWMGRSDVQIFGAGGDAVVATALSRRGDVVEEVEVEVPAGRFAAYRVRVVQRSGEGEEMVEVMETSWLAPGVGLVKSVVERVQGGVLGRRTTVELKSFSGE
jgi:hypothetical protein